MTDPIRIAVFASGRGSNFQAIQRTLLSMEQPPARIVLCISNNPAPGAFEYAAGEGIETMRLSPKMFDAADEYARVLSETLRRYGVEMIVLAGYMRKLPGNVVQEYRGRIFNIHPALLPEFGGEGMYGARVHEAVIASGAAESGASVHLVDEEYDTGPVVAQERIPVREGETPETLAARVLEVEHRLFPRVVIETARRLLNDRSTGGTV